MVIEKILKAEQYAPRITHIRVGDGDDTIDVAVKPFLTLEERRDFVNHVLSIVFVETSRGFGYCAHFEDFAWKYCILTSYTDVDLPDDPETAWLFMKCTNLADEVEAMIDEKEALEISRMTRRAIDDVKARLPKETTADKILNQLGELLTEAKEKIYGIDPKQILDYVKEAMPELGQKIEEALSTTEHQE